MSLFHQGITPEEAKAILSPGLPVHMLGIGGVSMSALAEYLADTGHPVSGSDRVPGESFPRLEKRGIRVTVGHRAEELAPDTGLLVYSLAIAEDNPVLNEAHRRGIPCMSRAELLGGIMPDFPVRVGISGTHGKSSTTALLSHVLSALGRHPVVLSGAAGENGSAYTPGGRECLVYEACEYKDSFLHFAPTHAVFLNMEWDHTDYFHTPEAMAESFRRAAALAGRVYLGTDDPALAALAPDFPDAVTFGTAGTPTLLLRDVQEEHGYFRATPYYRGQQLPPLLSGTPGAMGLSHAAAVLAFCLDCGEDPVAVLRAIPTFRGIPRRLEYLGRTSACRYYYDYAHHPTEIRAGIRTLLAFAPRPLTVIFRPHTYTRTRDLWEDFVAALRNADRVILTDVYPAREEPISGVDAPHLATAVGDSASYVPLTDLSRRLPDLSGTAVLMGAGSYGKIIENLCETLDKTSPVV